MTGINGLVAALSADPTAASLSGTGFSVTANSFPAVRLYGNASSTMSVTGSTGDDTLSVIAGGAVLTGADFSTRAFNTNGTLVNIYGNGGSDTATFTGQLNLADTLTTVNGATRYTQIASPAYLVRANNFASVTATANAVNDTAVVTGTSGNDTLTASPTAFTWSGGGYSVTGNSFATLTASQGGGK